LAKRKAALLAAKQTLVDVHNRLKTFLNLPGLEYNDLRIIPQDRPGLNPYKLVSTFDEYYQWVLETWPSYRALQKNVLIQSEEIKSAKDEKRPRLDLKLGYTSNSLRNEYDFDKLAENEYPSWYIGLNFTMLLQGNERATAKEQMAIYKQQQHQIDLDATKVGLINDLKAKLSQVETTYQELLSLEESVKMLELVYDSEYQRFELGQGRLFDLYDREDRLIIEKQRWIEGQVKYELAKVALSVSDGSLLDQYHVLLRSNLKKQDRPYPIIEVTR
jgi:outer membrane protein TolC